MCFAVSIGIAKRSRTGASVLPYSNFSTDEGPIKIVIFLNVDSSAAYILIFNGVLHAQFKNAYLCLSFLSYEHAKRVSGMIAFLKR
jgi:hypothetical protein